MKRTSKNGERLTNDEQAFIEKALKAKQPACPDCGEGVLYEGPHGGLSVNVLCGNATCGSKFNFMTPFGIDRISDASPKKPPSPSLSDGSPYR